MNSAAPHPPPVHIVGWIIWFAILNGLAIMQFLIGGGLPPARTSAKPLRSSNTCPSPQRSSP
ncbi:hypothetical protein LDC_2050 [sediment metagenome]|uniref:Uncharacterized protein n=1 Tax=sediment metagenome TaxID=749907 RepID=D9PKI3_9ZZZZ